MPIIRPCADLRNNYNEISKICRETKQPVFITKNGRNDLVLLSNETYETLAEDRVNKKMEEEFKKKYPTFESFKKDFEKTIETALKEIEEGKCQPAEEFFKEMEEKYGIHE